MSSTDASYSRGANFEVDDTDAILTPEEQRLHTAAKCCSDESIEEIGVLISGQGGYPPVDVNSRNAVDRTALHWAAGNNNTAALKVLIQYGASVDAKDIFGMNAILWAAWFGHVDAVCLLIKAGAVTESKNKNGLSILHCAATNNHVNIIEICRQELQDFNVDTTDTHQRTSLHVAARGGRQESVQALLDLRADCKYEDKNAETALHLAAKYGHTECVDTLLNFDADPNAVSKKGETPLHLSCQGGYTEVVTLLLCALASVDGEPIKVLSSEIESTAEEDPSTSASGSLDDEKGLTRPIHIAAQIGRAEIITLLVENGVSINALNELKQSALHLATIHSRLEGAEVLLKFGINPNIRDNRSEVPLHLAAENGSTELSEVLLKHGADIKVRDGKGKTPLMVAARGNYVTIVDMIIKAERCHLLFGDTLSDEILQKINFKPDSSIDTQFIRNLLFKLSTKYLRRNEWKLLGQFWKFTDTQIRSIEEQWIGEKSYREHAHRMLLIWLHGCLLSKQNPIKGIFEALCHLDRRDLAEQMRSKANQGPQDEKSCAIQ